jgi:hypothetical protein
MVQKLEQWFKARGRTEEAEALRKRFPAAFKP